MKPLNSLLIIAFLIAAIWRIEIEFRGWGGLKWVEYRHWAIPIGGLIYLSWVKQLTARNPRSWTIVSWVALWGIAASTVLDYAARAHFAGGPGSMFYIMFFGDNFFDFIRWYAAAIWGITFLLLYAGFLFLFQFPLITWAKGFTLWMASWHIGLLIITLIPERGYHDLIHALKTGWMIPFCVMAVSLPLISSKPKDSS